MYELLEIFWIFDFFTTFMGILLNSLLIFTIIKSTTKMQKYSYLFLVTSSFDMLVALVELLTAHQIKIKNGIIFVMPQGVERHLPQFKELFFAIHCFVGYNSLLVIPAQYRYRYAIMTESTNDNGSLRGLFHDMLIGVSTAAALGIFASVSVWEASKRSLNDYYLPILGDEEEGIKKLIMYTVDMQDLSACLTTYIGWVSGNLTTIITIFYIYKSWRFMNSNTVQVSQNTKNMQAQFTRSLIAQTLNTVFFAITPIVLMSAALIFRWDYSFLGIGILLPFNSMPAINALLTMYLIKAYRRYILQLLPFSTKDRKKSDVEPMPTSFVISHRKSSINQFDPQFK